MIAGEARGTRLKLVPGNSTRPITDRVKESLFNIIGPDIQRAQFLDLFAGTGSVGIEALSRGAGFTRFIDNNKRAIQIIHDNLKATKLASKAEVIRMDAFALLKSAPDHIFDYIYIAPPQYKNLWGRALHAIDDNPDWLTSAAWVIVQVDPQEYEFKELQFLKEFDQRRYGNTLLVFYINRN